MNLIQEKENKHENRHENYTMGVPVMYIDGIMAVAKEDLDAYIDAKVGLLLADFLLQSAKS